MSLKSLIQIIIILVIIIILGSVYFNYFSNYNDVSLENNEQNIQAEIENNIAKENKKTNLSSETIKNNGNEKLKNLNQESSLNKDKKLENNEINPKEKTKIKKPEIDNTVKDIEYLTTDNNGNKYKILASSGKTNSENNNILDLENVRGVITSKERSTIYIVSDFAEYNSSNLNSNFYQNVVINYEDKEITCDYFDVDMQTNIAIAYNNVVVTDTNSIMKAGKIILNIQTKVININPENKKNKVSVTIN
ncbi:MAG: LPS export ABC transporter periplasmic protein LptC [Candidatus Pelagibacter sp.]